MIIPLEPVPTNFGDTCTIGAYKQLSWSRNVDGTITVQLDAFTDQKSALDGSRSVPDCGGSLTLDPTQLPQLAQAIAAVDSIIAGMSGPWGGGKVVSDQSQ